MSFAHRLFSWNSRKKTQGKKEQFLSISNILIEFEN